MKKEEILDQLLEGSIKLKRDRKVEAVIPEFSIEDVLGKFRVQKGKPLPKTLENSRCTRIALQVHLLSSCQSSVTSSLKLLESVLFNEDKTVLLSGAVQWLTYNGVRIRSHYISNIKMCPTVY